MGAIHNEKRRVKSADTLFGVIELLQKREGAGVTEIAQELGVAKSTVHDHLSTLVDKKYVVKNGSEYRVGLKFLDHGIHARNTYYISNLVQPILNDIVEETGEAAWFLVEEHGKAVYLNRALGQHGVQTHPRIGKREYMHCLASGKVLLAHMPQERVPTIVDEYGLPRMTEQTITDLDELLAELAEIRNRGYAYNNGERVLRLKSIAAPVLGNENRILGSISIPGPKRRVENTDFQQEIINVLLAATNEVELRYEYSKNS